MEIVDPAVAPYATAHTTPDQGRLAEVADRTQRSVPMPIMMGGLVEVRVLEALIHVSGATRVLEVGTLSGYTALTMAAALPEGGTVTTLEFDEAMVRLAREHIAASPHGDRVNLIAGDARETVQRLDGPFDLVFIDAWKPDYPHYFEAVLPKLSPRGVILADNVLWRGTVVDPAADDDQARAIAAFNAQVQADPRVRNALLTVGDGLLLIWPA